MCQRGCLYVTGQGKELPWRTVGSFGQCDMKFKVTWNIIIANLPCCAYICALVTKSPRSLKTSIDPYSVEIKLQMPWTPTLVVAVLKHTRSRVPEDLVSNDSTLCLSHFLNLLSLGSTSSGVDHYLILSKKGPCFQYAYFGEVFPITSKL